MRFKMSFLIDSGYLGPLMTTLHAFPMEDFELQGAEPAEPYVMAGSPPPIKSVQKKRKHRGTTGARKRIPFDPNRPTIKEAIWNFVKNAPEPQTVSAIRQGLVRGGYNENSIPSQLASLKVDGRLAEQGSSIPKRYAAK
jgi:hypothetical protein